MGQLHPHAKRIACYSGVECSPFLAELKVECMEDGEADYPARRDKEGLVFAINVFPPCANVGCVGWNPIRNDMAKLFGNACRYALHPHEQARKW